eukprot:TRINITY_DN5234_c0_g1_i2.p1 TRINITY_DN5234_c0_g1~~TRINITY_DN5234_c0_g1_i2.p1  ORF type:complete len:622 (-),score=97.90 TRINITY_DN5234_c0_g1_i2:58-1923(-)
MTQCCSLGLTAVLLLFVSLVTAVPSFTEQEPNDDLSSSNGPWEAPFRVKASLQESADQDWYNISILVPGSFVVQTFSPDCGIDDGITDTELELWFPNRSRFAFDDDSGTGASSKITVSLEVGTVFVLVRSFSHLQRSGTYELVFVRSGDELCEQADCHWSSWESWGSCSSQCGGGTVIRSRAGTSCGNKRDSQSLPCNVQSCSTTTPSCSWGSWSEWSECDHNNCVAERWATRNEVSEGACSSPLLMRENRTCECSILPVKDQLDQTFWVPIRIEGYLDPDEVNLYRFYFPSSGVYVIQTFSPCSSSCGVNTDTILSLLSDDKSTRITTADDNGAFPPCDELVVTLVDDGYYWIEVASFNPYVGVGRFGLVVRRLDTPFSPECNDNVLSYDWFPQRTQSLWRTMCTATEPGFDYDHANDLMSLPFYVVEATFTEESKDHYYLFEVTVEDHYTFRTLAATYHKTSQSSGECWEQFCDIDTVLTLRDEYGHILGRNDDSFARCSEVNSLLSPGFYFLTVSSFGDTHPGSKYSVVGVQSMQLNDAIRWCNGVSPTECLSEENNVYSIHPVWISLLVGLLGFIGSTLLIALLTHFGRSLYSPMGPVITDLPEDDHVGVDLESESL